MKVMRKNWTDTCMVKRGYDGKVIKQQMNKVINTKREELLTSRPKKAGQITTLAVTYHPDLSNLMYILHDHQCIIDVSPRLWGALLKPPSNRRDLLVRVMYGQTKETYRGNSQCQQPCCNMCLHMKTGTSFCSKTTSKRLHVKATVDCWTRNVVYLIECKKWAIQYVGETENALRVCPTGHQSDINIAE